MDGGGCAIFSQREFYAEASKLIQHLQKQKGRALSPGEWDI
jgi:DNA replication initiation complex subunit (GINS family)